MSKSTIYVGRISERTRDRELEDLFSKYGKVNAVSLKYGYGFVEMDDSRDADDAVKALDGYDLDDSRLIVEHSRGGGARRDDDRGSRGDSYKRRREMLDNLTRIDDEGSPFPLLPSCPKDSICTKRGS